MKNFYLIATAACTCISPFAAAQEYPLKTIRMVVPFPPGGGSDTIARVLAQRLAATMGQTIVSDNRAGASGNIAADIVAKAPGDGYTLLFGNSSLSISPAAYAKLSYDPIKDLTPISMVSSYPFVLVSHPSLPVKNVRELIVFTKAHPNEIMFSSSGNGTGQHLAMELLNRMANLQLVHVPYKGTAPSILDLVAGRVSVTSASAISTMPYVRTGKLRALAVSSANRSPSVPELVTVAEAGLPGFAVDQWYALFAPAGTSPAIIAKLYREIAKAVAQTDTRERLLAMGLDPVGMPPDEFMAYLKTETVKWGKLIREAGIRAN